MGRGKKSKKSQFFAQFLTWVLANGRGHRAVRGAGVSSTVSRQLQAIANTVNRMNQIVAANGQ